MADPMSVKGIPTMFGEISERNVCFLIDTSGSMYTSIEVVKEHLVEALLKHACTHKDAMFNIVEFNSEVSQWADKMVSCTADTVKIAADWIQKLHAKTGTNTQDALLTAFCDPGCEAVYLVTDGLPDQNPEDILDHVAYASQNRPVHCIYLTGTNSETRATEFLRDLAHETYGSFHIVTITNHGCVDRVTPVYRSDHTAKRILRTTQGAIIPNEKNCSVTTTLLADPLDTVEIAPELMAPRVYLKDGVPIYHPAYPYLDPYLYPYHGVWPHYPYHYWPHLRSAPYYNWARYRPAKAWLQEQKKIIDTSNNIAFSPAAGSLLVDKQVLARRADDGFYYTGRVQSQLSTDKFLVELGPTKHGKYTDSAYQETFVYDIISKSDAMRHAIVAGDKVLAPWEPEGERYCPGVVLEGSEKRAAEGGGEDRELSVSFVIGKSAKVPFNTAVWLPLELYERLSLELKMPKGARKTLESLESYPERSLPGYPATETKRSPEAYEGPQPVTIGPSTLVYDHGQYYHPDYIPITPVMFKHQKKKSAVTAAELDKLVPGTHMTESELNEKVMSQLMEHKMRLEGKKDRLENDIRMLRREKMKKENSLRKSVEFDLSRDEVGYERDLDFYDLETQDSGMGLSLTDTEDVSTQTRSTDISLGEKKRRKVKKEPWRYWRSDPSPSLLKEPMHEPYKETAVEAPLENRDITVGPYGVQWSNSAFGYVDHMARSKYDREVLEKMIHEPRPPTVNKQATTKSLADGSMTREEKEDARREFRRKRILARQQEFYDRLDRQDRMKLLMTDQHREQVKERLDFENQRRQKEMEQIERSREAKRELQKELTSTVNNKSRDNSEREARKIEFMRQRQAQREESRAERLKQAQEQASQRQEAKSERAQDRWNQTHERLVQEEAQNADRDQQMRSAKISRIEHFRKLEDEGQAKRGDGTGITTDQHQSLYRSNFVLA